MDNKTIIRVCMGPAGIAAGGKKVLDAFSAALSGSGIAATLKENCSSHQVGCLGLCARDVLVEVHQNGSKTVYQYVKPDMVQRIVDEHLVGGTPVKEWLVDGAYDAFYKKQVKVVLSDCGRIDPEEIERLRGRRRIRSCKGSASFLVPGRGHRGDKDVGPPRPRRRGLPHRAQVGTGQKGPGATPNTSSATPTKETRARSWTGPSSKAMPIR